MTLKIIQHDNEEVPVMKPEIFDGWQLSYENEERTKGIMMLELPNNRGEIVRVSFPVDVTVSKKEE